MTKPIDDGGSAFPQIDIKGAGMTLRDYFAAKAMQAIAADLSRATGIGDNVRRIANLNADLAYLQADAMIRARQA